MEGKHFESHVNMDFNLQSVFLIKSSFLESDSCTSSTGGPSIDGTNFGTEQHRYLAFVSRTLKKIVHAENKSGSFKKGWLSPTSGIIGRKTSWCYFVFKIFITDDLFGSVIILVKSMVLF